MEVFVSAFERHKTILIVASKISNIVTCDFESGYESGYIFARQFNNNKNYNFSNFYSNTIKSHSFVKCYGHYTSLADFKWL